jgi:hypothetical protein
MLIMGSVINRSTAHIHENTHKKTSVKMPWKSLSLAVKLNVVRYTEAHHQLYVCINNGHSRINSIIYAYALELVESAV